MMSEDFRPNVVYANSIRIFHQIVRIYEPSSDIRYCAKL